MKFQKRPPPATCPACGVGQLYSVTWPNGDRRRVCPACGYQQAADRRPAATAGQTIDELYTEVRQ